MHSDEEYIAGVQRSDAVVFTALVNAYIDPLIRFAFGLTGVEDAAHDVVQDVFARIWQLGPDWAPRGSIAAYLFTAVRHRVLNWLKANRAQQRLQDTLRGEIESDVFEESGADSLLVSLVQREFHALTERQRVALQLRYEQELSMPEVAAVLGIALRPAEKLVARALATLRERLTYLWREIDE